MTDWPGALARAFQQHLEIGGSSGSASSRRKITKQSNGFQGREPGTSSPNAVVPVVPETNPSCGPENHCNHCGFEDGSWSRQARRSARTVAC